MLIYTLIGSIHACQQNIAIHKVVLCEESLYARRIARHNSGAIGDLTMGDASGDGVVNSADLNIVRANWGAGTPSPAAARTDSEDTTRASSSSFIGPRRESASDEALSSWTNSNSDHGLSDFDLVSLAEAAWLQEIEGLRSKGKRRDVERVSVSEMVFDGRVRWDRCHSGPAERALF